MPRTESSVRLATGVALPYVDQGDAGGVPLLLLHGPTDSHRSFAPLLDHLPPTVRALAPTQRGHAGADAPPAGYRPQDLAADAAAFLDALEVPAAVVAGHSGAGFTALRLGVEHPGRVLGLVLIAVPRSLHDKPRFLAFADEAQRLSDPIDPAYVRGFVGGTVGAEIAPEVVEAAVADACAVPARVWAATFRGLADEGVPQVPAGVPALLVWGEDDELCTRSDQEAVLTALPGARLVACPGVGHSPHWERPELCAPDIAAFTQRVGRLSR